MADSNRPLLSIGMIVKNESRCLEQTLQALQPLRERLNCQLVIADTGSSDNTREIASRFADVLFDFEWINDFSAARNAVMDRCTGQWFLSLDADERMDEDCHDLIDFLTGPEVSEYTAGSICVRNYTSRNEPDKYSDFSAVRLLRMDTGDRFKGRIHEMFSQLHALIKQVTTVFHHDGYLFMDKKSVRNMPLLEDELKRDPYSIRRIVQCIESARDKEERKKFIHRGLRVIRAGKSKMPIWEPIVYRHEIIDLGKEGKVDEALELLREAEERYPSSIYIQIDAQASVMQACYVNQRHQEAAEHGLIWKKHRRALDLEGIGKDELVLDTLAYSTSATPIFDGMLFDVMRRTERWSEGEDVLEQIDFSDVKDTTNWASLVNAIFECGDKLVHSGRHLQRLWDTADQNTTAYPRSTWPENRAYLMRLLNAHFMLPEKQTSMHPAALALEHCEPGRSARIFHMQDPVSVAGELDKVACWEDVLYAVYPHAMRLGVQMPEVFLHQTRETLAELAVHLAAYDPDFTALVIRYSAMDYLWSSLAGLNWLLDLVLTAIHGEQWKDPKQGMALCLLFGRVIQAMLTALYRPECLDEAQLNVLPGIHRFGWYYLQAHEEYQRGNYTAYLRTLRNGLSTATAMKKMVDFLAGHAKQMQEESRLTAIKDASPELVKLAEQVRGILAAYPADDPAVQALKQSPAYQQVAFLIEEPASQFRM